jgi:hypothetical protein
LETFVYVFGSIWGCPNAPKQHKKSSFLVVLDHFFFKNGPNDMVRGLSLSLNIGTYILPICGPLGTFLAPFGGIQMPQNSIKNYFLVVLDYFFNIIGLNDLVRGLFLSLDIGTSIPSTFKPLCNFLAPFGGAQMSQQHKKLSSGCFGLFLLEQWA